MGKIRILPDVLAHKIAAGEVVERPASVVKELLENALDARARRIVVEADSGGKRRISVRDDGVGMSPEDARLAFQHHATSKIENFEDLSQIRTLGFRGEALPSIASVARLRLRTKEGAGTETGSPLGTEIEIEGGTLKAEREISWPAGTEVAVEDLFFNVPARRKFLKAATTELSHLSRQVMHYAMAYPEVEFQFSHQQRSVLEAAAVANLEDRIYQVLGESFLESLVPVEYEKGGVFVSGFTSLPHEQRASSTSQFLYVNRRMVKDRVLMHAIRLAYQDLIPPSAYPVVILLLEVDPKQVDVNVHPCKTEIRFRDSNSVHSALYHGLEEALLRQKRTLSNLARDISADRLEGADRLHAGSDVATSIANFFERYSQTRSGFPALARASGTPFSGSTSVETSSKQFSSSLPVGNGDAHGDGIPETDYVSPIPVVLGQFVESFVVAADREGVMLVDQHVAHERILYDRALHALRCSERCPTQRLLIPLTYELSAQHRAILEQIIDDLNANGFEVEWFGTQTIAIKGVPSFAQECDARLLIQEILDGFGSPRQELEGRDRLVRRLREKIAVGLSCRGAIKINTPLSEEKMQWLLDELFRCENPFTCPHGRPIVLRLGIEEILRGFKRI
ncbi:MAG: DNA mismatch repair endonuclease MutL [Acidobacteriota bacterium]